VNATESGGSPARDERGAVLDQIGQEIRTLRRLRGLTMKELARRTGKTTGFISQLERGLSRASLTTLQDLADALEVPLAWLFRAGDDDDAESAERRYVLRRERRRPRAPTRHGSTEYLALEDFLATPASAANMGLGITRFRAGGGSGGEPEKVDYGFFALLREGELELSVDGETIGLGAGDAFYVPARTPYRLVNRGSGEAEFVWVATPHGVKPRST